MDNSASLNGDRLIIKFDNTAHKDYRADVNVKTYNQCIGLFLKAIGMATELKIGNESYIVNISSLKNAWLSPGILNNKPTLDHKQIKESIEDTMQQKKLTGRLKLGDFESECEYSWFDMKETNFKFARFNLMENEGLCKSVLSALESINEQTQDKETKKSVDELINYTHGQINAARGEVVEQIPCQMLILADKDTGEFAGIATFNHCHDISERNRGEMFAIRTIVSDPRRIKSKGDKNSENNLANPKLNTGAGSAMIDCLKKAAICRGCTHLAAFDICKNATPFYTAKGFKTETILNAKPIYEGRYVIRHDEITHGYLPLDKKKNNMK